MRIFEVGARDGLQNEPKIVDAATKVKLIERLSAAGLRDIECGAFVRPDLVPQMADTEKVWKKLKGSRTLSSSTRVWALVANQKGLERALASQVPNVAVFTASTDGFNRANVGRSVQKHLEELKPIVAQAKAAGLRVRGYVSTAFGCPFEGRVDPKKPIFVSEALFGLGADEISLGDTIGVATPGDLPAVIKPLLASIGPQKLALHFHDTRGTALANVVRAMDLGVDFFDASAGGLGGCPFAPGATGNLATEDLLYLLQGSGVPTGVDLQAVCETSLWLAERMKRKLTSRYLAAYASARKPARGASRPKPGKASSAKRGKPKK